MEIIVVDDASSDATPEVVRRFPRVQHIKFDKHRGVSTACNTGIKASSGAYIAFLDDDLWLPQKLRLQVPVLEANTAAGLAYGQTISRFEGKESFGPSPDQAPSGMIFREVLMGFSPSYAEHADPPGSVRKSG